MRIASMVLSSRLLLSLIRFFFSPRALNGCRPARDPPRAARLICRDLCAVQGKASRRPIGHIERADQASSVLVIVIFELHSERPKRRASTDHRRVAVSWRSYAASAKRRRITDTASRSRECGVLSTRDRGSGDPSTCNKESSSPLDSVEPTLSVDSQIATSCLMSALFGPRATKRPLRWIDLAE